MMYVKGLAQAWLRESDSLEGSTIRTSTSPGGSHRFHWSGPTGSVVTRHLQALCLFLCFQYTIESCVQNSMTSVITQLGLPYGIMNLLKL